jgi:tryptophan synthase alpha chain
MNGVEHITGTFDGLNREGRAALMPYYTLGYPNPETSLEVVLALSSAGADLIELGIPFSDPLADGPTIQASTQAALEQGTTVARCLELVGRARRQGVRQPLILMGYFNPILSYGLNRFVMDAVGAGADGLIVPDLPMEEAAELEALCRSHGCALVYLASPATTPARLEMLASRTAGFLYLVSLNGVTGARQTLPTDLGEFVERTRRATTIPLAVGFGISTPGQAAMVAQLADGVIIGSALINAVTNASDPVEGAAAFLMNIRASMQSVLLNRNPA